MSGRSSLQVNRLGLVTPSLQGVAHTLASLLNASFQELAFSQMSTLAFLNLV
ncbi:hypothetical protein M413DRAFT_444813 [Hebeloma cylindrosporum]|uniref:Uncharacterized protein n=1 Tax=Hebeloma cylindrosporum TaxID=76867 RepID=A0A0C3CDV3_HEBCY|nr:hypothetical protein M413DRAFT_444813 [Hebeloma cylindrosporum h7]